MKRSWLTITALSAALFLTACSKGELNGKPSSNTDEIQTGLSSSHRRNRILKVTDVYGQPIPQALVLIGEGLNQPFASNFVTTDSNGSFQAPEAWTTPQVVTVAGRGFVRVSYFDQMPEGQTFQLRASQPSAAYELKGKGTGFQVKDSDNLIDFALMIPAVQKQDLFSFNLSMFISPKTDTVTVYGNDIDLPSNISLPRQRENYSIMPVTLEKPVYRMYFDALGVQRVVTVRGQFPFKQVVSEMQNHKPFIELINYFSLKSGSMKEVAITQASQVMDLPVNEIPFNLVRGFVTPAFQTDEFVLAVALSPFQDQFIPTDFKNVPSNSNVNLTTTSGVNSQLMVALKKKSEQDQMTSGKLSAAVIPFQAGVRPVLLPLVENPQVLSLTDLRAQVPAAPSAVKPVATYAVMSSIENRGTGADAVEVKTRLWEVYAKDWKSELHLPHWPDESLAPGAKRWEVTFMGTQSRSNKPVDLSPRILETVTHATHSAADF